MTRRIVIEIERVAPEPHAVTQFKPFLRAKASVVCDSEGTLQNAIRCDMDDPLRLAQAALVDLNAASVPLAPNERFCHTPLACTLTGRCEKQFGPTGTACCE